MADWKTTSEAGFNFEDFCLNDIIKKKYPLAVKNTNKDDYSYYDIVIPIGDDMNNKKTIECKFDERAHETGNICIETGCNGRLSGLLITKADYWIIGDIEEIFLITKDAIHDCIIKNIDNISYKSKYPVSQGDGEYKLMNFYLIPKKIFKHWCLEISNINEMKYDKLV